jgi:REP element-mobilizing transposase RayT
MSYDTVRNEINKYVDSILKNEIELINTNDKTNLLQQIYELLKKNINDSEIIFEINKERVHLHFQNEEKQIIYSMIINLIINNINKRIQSNARLCMVYFSAQSNIESEYMLCFGLYNAHPSNNDILRLQPTTSFNK